MDFGCPSLFFSKKIPMSAPAVTVPFHQVQTVKVKCDRIDTSNPQANVMTLPLNFDSNDFEWQVDPERMYIDVEGGQYNKPRIIVNLNTAERDAWERLMNQCEKAIGKRLGNDYEFKSVLWNSKRESGLALEFRTYPKKGFVLDSAEGQEVVKDLAVLKDKELLKLKGQLFPWARMEVDYKTKASVHRCGLTLFLTEVHAI